MTTATQPGLAALFGPYTPIGYTSWGPIHPVQGGRRSTAVEFIVGDDDGADPSFADEGDDDDDDERDRPAVMRGKKPAKRARVKAELVSDDEDDDEQDDDEDDGEDDSEDGTWTPPTREAYTNMELALQRANREAARRRRVGKVLETLQIPPGQELEWFRAKGIDPETGQMLDVDTEDPAHEQVGESDLFESEEPQRADPARDAAGRYTKEDVKRFETRAEQRAAIRAQQRYEPLTVELAAEAQLRAAGWKGKNIATALRFIDPREIEIAFDDEGRADFPGLDEQIEEMKAEFPDWFRSDEERPARRTSTRPARTGARAVDGADRGKSPAAPRSWQEQMADRLAR